MSMGLLLLNSAAGLVGGYLIFKRFKHLGLLAAGLSLSIVSTIAIGRESWILSLIDLPLAYLLVQLIGDPLDLG